MFKPETCSSLSFSVALDILHFHVVTLWSQVMSYTDGNSCSAGIIDV
jgi:hypothetical protein